MIIGYHIYIYIICKLPWLPYKELISLERLISMVAMVAMVAITNPLQLTVDGGRVTVTLDNKEIVKYTSRWPRYI